MNKILIFSDIHIHNHHNSLDRLDDCLKCLEWIFNTAREQSINTIICGGDLFQSRSKIDIMVYQKTFEIFEKNSDITVYILMGNHDMWYAESHEISSLIPLRALPKIKIIDEPCCLNILGKDIDFLPYTKNPNIEIEKYFNKKSDILFGHLSVNGAYLNMLYKTMSEVSVEHNGETVEVDISLFNGWKKVFLGHFHGYQKLNENVLYAGSPLQLNYNEVFQQKYIITLDLDNLEIELFENKTSPRHLIIKETEVDNYKIDGNFLQIICEDLNSPTVIDLKNRIKDRVRTLEFKESKKEHKKIELKGEIEDAKKALCEGEIIEKFTSLTKTDLNLDKLIWIGKEIIKKATVN